MGKGKNEKTKKYKIEEAKEKKPKKKKKSKTGNEETKALKVTKKRKGKKKHKILKRVIIGMLLLILIAIMVLAGIVVGIFSSDKYKISREEIEVKNTNSRIVYDGNGETIVVLRADENIKVVQLDEMPEYLPKAFIAIEDKRFYEHKGIDVTRTLSATLNFILKKGDSSYGGSTITQQLIKNHFKDSDDEGIAGVERKIREMARAYNLEKVLSKDEILEKYLNKIFMGGTNNGVYAGSIYYFNKPVDQLSLAQCAFLAGINHSPNAYNPFKEEKDNSEKIKTRTKTVLSEMKSQGYITDEEVYNAAVAEVDNGLAFSQGQISTGTNYSYHTAALIEQVIKDLMEAKEITREAAKEDLYNNGYVIYSTVDPTIQARMEEEYKKDKYIYQPRDKKDGKLVNSGHSQSAMVIINHENGHVVGTVGGLGTDSNALGVNRATQGQIQPGSSFKPIGVIAPALEEGIITAATVYDDSYTDFGKGYTPHNSGGFAGLLTIRHAIERSSNVVSVKVMAELGPRKSMDYLKNMDIDIDSLHEGISLALGTASVSPLEMAAAYAAIANEGVYITPTFYTRVVDSQGKTVVEAKQEQRRVLTVQNAYILTSILTAPVTGPNGTVGSSCKISGIEVAAKTGSTEEYKDRWLCGFTPYYAAATWFGFDVPEQPSGGNNNARTIWGAVMKDIHKDLPNASFAKPENIVTASICLDTGCVATASCARAETESFVVGTVPKACEGHKKLRICVDTGKIANEYCTNVEERTFLAKPEKEDTKLWNTPNNGKYNIVTETCVDHKAAEKIDVTNVVGKKSDVAKKELEDKGLKVEIKYEEDKNKDNGVVLKQSVDGGQKVDKGSTITLTVNKKETTSTNTNDINGNKTNTITNTITNTTPPKNNTQVPATNTVKNPQNSNIVE